MDNTTRSQKLAIEGLTADPCDPPLDGFAQLLDLPLSDGLHLRGVSAEVSRDRSHHCLHVQRLVERIERAAIWMTFDVEEQYFMCFLLYRHAEWKLDIRIVRREGYECSRPRVEPGIIASR